MLSRHHAVSVVRAQVRVGDWKNSGNTTRALRREAETNGDGRVVRNRDSLSFGGVCVCVSRADTMSCAARCPRLD